MSKHLIAGVALAAAVMTGQSADAGHRHHHRSCGCCTSGTMSSQGGWYFARSGSGYYVPMARNKTAQAAPAVGGPPVATGTGQTIRRFSEEPNTPAVPVANGAIYRVGPSYSPRFNAPTVGTSIPPNPSSTPARNPVERRLHPGGGWMRN